MFELTEIEESIYEGVVETTYKKLTRADANRADHRSIRRRYAVLSITFSEINESAVKHINRYADHPMDRSEITCTIHEPGHSSDECKVLGDFGSKCLQYTR